MFDRLASSNNWTITKSEDSSVFDSIPSHDAIVFLQTTGNDLLNQTQQDNLIAYIASRKGFIGIHAATDAEYTWSWYGDNLIGANFQDHPPQLQQATIHISNHSIMQSVIQELNSVFWVRTDEWYNFDRNPRQNPNLTNIQILGALDETTYSGGTMGSDHPIIWCHESNGGREFYTGLGHGDESYTEPAFETHIISAVRWVTYQNATSPPDEGSGSIHLSSMSMHVFAILYCLCMLM